MADKAPKRSRWPAKTIVLMMIPVFILIHVGVYFFCRTYEQHRWASIPGTTGTVVIGYCIEGDTVGYSDVCSHRIFKHGGGWTYERYGTRKMSVVRYLPLVYRPLEHLEVHIRGLGGESRLYWQESGK